MPHKVLITKPIPEIGIQLLKAANIEVTIPESPLPYNILIETAKNFDAVVSVGLNDLNADFMYENSHLKGIALYSVGYDTVDVATASEVGIPISNTPDVSSEATADTAFLLMLATSRRASHNFSLLKEGKWRAINVTEDLGMDIKGKTLGIYGMGGIGASFAEKAHRAYGMKVIYHNRTKKPEGYFNFPAEYVDFDTLLATSDVLSLHANLSTENTNLFDKAAFEKMKSTAIFINTARGGMVNEGDLYDALVNQEIWGAGLDVTNPEPISADSPLLGLSTVCVLPHIGSATIDTRNVMAEMVAQNIIAALNDEPMPQVIDKEFYEFSMA